MLNPSYNYYKAGSKQPKQSKQSRQLKQQYSMLAEDSTDEGQNLDLETGLPRYRSRTKHRSVLSKVLHKLHGRHKVAFWHIILGSASLCFCVLLIMAEVYWYIVRSASLVPSRQVTHPYGDLHNLVMVAGHAVYSSSGCKSANGEDSWFLEPYQRHAGQAATFVQHIKAGVEFVALDENALLLFSGGETRKEAGPRSEAQSYWMVAEAADWFDKFLENPMANSDQLGLKEEVRWRALTEEYARDSFENLLFSICRFKELTGIYPWNITVVGYDFKEHRFANLHRVALRFPASHFFYKGTPATASSVAATFKGEASVQMQFQEDPYGCIGSLHTKRINRDPFIRAVPYPEGCLELKELFSYCGTTVFPGKLPWDG